MFKMKSEMRERLITAKQEMDRIAYDREFYSIINENDRVSISVNAVLRELSMLGLHESANEIKYRVTEGENPVAVSTDVIWNTKFDYLELNRLFFSLLSSDK